MLASFEQVRVLLVDDDEDDYIIVRDSLRGVETRKPVALEWIPTYEEGLATLGRGQIDVCLLDYRLGARDGLDFLREASQRGISTPIIVITGAGDAAIDRQAMAAGAADYLTKGQFEAIDLERSIFHALERSRTTATLMASDRMATMGMLAAGVAHEINNPLAVVLCNLELVSSTLNGHPPAEPLTTNTLRELAEILDDTRESAQRVAAIVRSLKMFSRVDEESHESLDLRRVFESTLRLAWNEIRHRARLVKDYGEVPPVLGNEARLGQVFLNVLINAAHAIPEGAADRNEIRIVTRHNGDGWVIIEVKDTGVGIPEEIRGRIFDAFFTTKPIGVGTGLGLSISRGIVAEFGGMIEVESAVGVGSLFRIKLPAGTPSEVSREPAWTYAPTRPARILVIDDEPAVARALSRAIGPRHEVVIHHRGREALAALAHDDRFDVIFCDVMLPEISCEEFYRSVERAIPALLERIVFVTGAAFTPAARAFLSQIRNECIEKPFAPRQIEALLRARLEPS